MQDPEGMFDTADGDIPTGNTRGSTVVSHAEICGTPWGGDIAIGQGDTTDSDDAGENYYENHYQQH